MSDSKPECRWTKDADNDWNAWETDCHELFAITDGTPSDNDMRYCCYCGGVLVEEIRAADLAEEEQSDV